MTDRFSVDPQDSMPPVSQAASCLFCYKLHKYPDGARMLLVGSIWTEILTETIHEEVTCFNNQTFLDSVAGGVILLSHLDNFYTQVFVAPSQTHPDSKQKRPSALLKASKRHCIEDLSSGCSSGPNDPPLGRLLRGCSRVLSELQDLVPIT